MAKAALRAKTPTDERAGLLAGLPKVDRLAGDPALAGVRKRLGVAAITQMARGAIEEARRRILEGAAGAGAAGAGAAGAGAVAAAGESAGAVAGGGTGEVAAGGVSLDALVADVAARAAASLAARARPVINATGVILHTNLGRAPLSGAAVEALARSAGRYTSIEMDLATGKRGARGAFAEEALARLSGAEAALVVNNNAAAVMLALSALAFGKKVLVSRGELVEIGGGFRVPDVLARSGAVLVEVGTTNKTRLDDYARAFDEGGVAAVLCVHQGNFKQIGFVERPDVGGLVRMAHERGAVAIHDLGGGALIELEPFGLRGEPTVMSSVAAGFDVVCFSTDKALGGPQGGALVGAEAAIARARRDPLARALRLGRLPLVALEATLASYLEGELDAVPALAAIRAPIEAVRGRAESWRAKLVGRGDGVVGGEGGVGSEGAEGGESGAGRAIARVVELDVAVGGGTLAEAPLASAGLSLEVADADGFVQRLRSGDPPVFARIHEGRVLFDARTVLPGEDEELIAAILAALGALSGAG